MNYNLTVDENLVAVTIPASMITSGMVIQFPSGKWVDLHVTSASTEDRVVIDAFDEVAEHVATYELPRETGVLTTYYRGGE